MWPDAPRRYSEENSPTLRRRIREKAARRSAVGLYQTNDATNLMPLLDHFRPPVLNRGSWEGFHGGWPMMMVMDLCKSLPEQYTAEPRVHLGRNFEVDVCTFDVEEESNSRTSKSGPGAATATWAPPQPTLTLELDPTEIYEYEVLIFDSQRRRELVAAIEIVSPANKDRPETRQAFVSKCAVLLQKKVCVSIIDLVTIKNFNLYSDVLEVFGQTDPSFAPSPPPTYAVTCRSHHLATRSRFESWAYPMVVGEILPALPIWLDNDHAISLDLEISYQQTCRALRLI
ncbi:MAG: DUF4058 family protein [Pirellulaceae bacterium]